jgi:Ni/Co efflux regulator RcnB
MKRITLAAAAALLMAGPLTGVASAQNHDRGQRDGGMNGGGRADNNDRGGRDGGANDGGRWNDNDRNGRGGQNGDGRWNDNDRNDRNDRVNDRRGDRDDRRGNRWDNRRHNGYTYNGRWYYGAPPAHYNGYQAGYRNWRRGDRLPSYYSSRYRQVDYRREHLRAPPRGYRYVEDDRGDMLLVGIATGVILSVILSQ